MDDVLAIPGRGFGTYDSPGSDSEDWAFNNRRGALMVEAGSTVKTAGDGAAPCYYLIEGEYITP